MQRLPSLTQAARFSAVAATVFTLNACTVKEDSPNGTPGTPSNSGENTTPPPSGTSEAAEPGMAIEGFNGETFAVLSTQTLGDGLIIEELRIGEGEACPEGATVKMEYHGTLADGTVFDTTRGEGPRGPWPLGNLIGGWQMGVPGMKVGGVRRLTIPYQYAYGEGGRGSIPPKADLTFIIELTEFQM